MIIPRSQIVSSMDRVWGCPSDCDKRLQCPPQAMQPRNHEDAQQYCRAPTHHTHLVCFADVQQNCAKATGRATQLLRNITTHMLRLGCCTTTHFFDTEIGIGICLRGCAPSVADPSRRIGTCKTITGKCMRWRSRVHEVAEESS